MMAETERDEPELEAGLTLDAVEADEGARPDDSERLEIIRMMGQFGAGDLILWNERKQPLTVVRRVSADDLRGQCLNFRRLGGRWAARATNEKYAANPMTEDEAKKYYGGVTPTGEFGHEFLLVCGPRGGLYRLSVQFSERRGRHIPVFQNRVRSRKHKSGRFRDSDAWDGMGTEVLRLARVGRDEDVDPDDVDPDDGSSFVSVDELAGRPLVSFPEDEGPTIHYEFTEQDVELGVVPDAVLDHARESLTTHGDEPAVGAYASTSGVTLNLSEFADVEPDELPGRFSAETFLAVERGEDGELVITEIPEHEHEDVITADGAYIAEIHDHEHSKGSRVCFGPSYPVFVEQGGKEAVKEAPSASYDGDYQRWVVDGEDLKTALDALVDVDGVDRITAPPRILKYLTE